eukprot:7128018-Pyramimonas_sp.AAC.1
MSNRVERTAANKDFYTSITVLRPPTSYLLLPRRHQDEHTIVLARSLSVCPLNPKLRDASQRQFY